MEVGVGPAIFAGPASKALTSEVRGVRRPVIGALAVVGSLVIAWPVGALAKTGPKGRHPTPAPTVTVTRTVAPPAKKTATPTPTPTHCQIQPGYPASEMTDQPWAEAKLDFTSAWQVTRGAGVKVAVIDSGVDTSNPQLAGHVQSIDLTHTGDRDCAAHGTGVAAIIGASDMRPRSLFYGVAPDAQLISIKYTNGETDSNGTIDMARGIVQAVQAGAKVINISSQTGPSTLLGQAVQYAQANNVVIVAASGNLSNQQAQSPKPAYPAAYPGVISVGAIGPDGKLSGYSNGSSAVSVVAPGSKIVSLWPGGAYSYNYEGTSFAAPFVAGTAALVRAAHPGLGYLQVKHRIEVTADGGTDVGSGYGVVDPVRAVTAVLPEENAGVAPPSSVAQPVSLMRPPVGDSSPRRFMEWFVPIILAVAAIAVAAGFIIPAGRRRGWQPGRRRRDTEQP